MKVTIVGAGAMGSLLAARLTLGMRSHAAEPGAMPELSEVVLFGRESDHLTAIRKHGLELRERDAQTETVEIAVTSNPADTSDSDLVFVCVKSWATAQAVAPLRTFIPASANVITMQNGLGNASVIREALRRDDGSRPHVWLGVTTQAAVRTAPGKVTHTSDGVTAIGRRVPQVTDELNNVAIAMRDNGWRTVAVDDIHRWVWRKLAINAAINPLTALAGVPNVAVSDDHELKQAALDVIREVVQVAAADGVRLNLEQIEQTMDAVARHVGNPFSSMYDDLASGQTEIDAINGQIVRHGKRTNIPTPVNALLLRLIHAKQRAATGEPMSTRPDWAPQA